MVKRNSIFGIINAFLLLLLAFTCLFPFINVLAVSLSENSAIVAGDVTFLPKGFELSAYGKIFQNESMIRSLFFTIFLTVGYVAIALFFSLLLAYPLSRKNLKGRGPIMLMVVFTMYFSAGMIPSYLLVQQLGLLNTVWALIIPVLIDSFQLIIMKTSFESMPDSLVEAAILDGCSHYGVLFRIMVPNSKPMIATIILFYAVGRWNNFQDALYYINNSDLYPLQLKLNDLIASATITLDIEVAASNNIVIPEALKSASLIFATLPILIVYPWLQKYIVTGAMVGAVKG